ncbi:hypothetical protein OCU04_009030 [Sclerotinia nivalis]|uniref:Uncharacterized protein n=1 Tax=Sclerotinia nivalis TaxID=352851 RepID=A0A9X0AH08_9HELO|nr:hypothetical protein OCU04_009030 [Sclerotinia nivalis]
MKNQVDGKSHSQIVYACAHCTEILMAYMDPATLSVFLIGRISQICFSIADMVNPFPTSPGTRVEFSMIYEFMHLFRQKDIEAVDDTKLACERCSFLRSMHSIYMCLQTNFYN